MTTVLLAIDDPQLRQACRQQLRAAGHATMALDRPLFLLSLSQRLLWDALCVDDSDLGHSALAVARESRPEPLVVGLGFEVEGTGRSLPLRLSEAGLLAAVRQPGSATAPVAVRLDPAARRVLLGDHEVHLSDIEYQLFSLLHRRRPGEVSLDEVAATVWGSVSEEPGGSALRVHVRNLRAKLAAAGLPDAIQSRRGRGYFLVI